MRVLFRSLFCSNAFVGADSAASSCFGPSPCEGRGRLGGGCVGPGATIHRHRASPRNPSPTLPCLRRGGSFCRSGFSREFCPGPSPHPPRIHQPLLPRPPRQRPPILTTQLMSKPRPLRLFRLHAQAQSLG